MFEINDNFLENKFPEPSKPAPPVPKCKPPRAYIRMLEKLLERARKGIDENNPQFYTDFYSAGKQDAYQEMWEHIARILRKECRDE